MPKKINNKLQVLSAQQQLSRASLKLERHLFRTHSQQINKLIEDSHHNISYSTYEKCKDLIRQTKKQVLFSAFPKSNAQFSEDSDHLQAEIKKAERLPTQFQQMLNRSEGSYERTSIILRNMSLRQKYRHLLGEVQSQQQKIDEKLEEEEQAALSRLKNLYRHYKVSNMFKKNVLKKIKRCLVQKLIKKGFIRQNKDILTLKT